jgi:hypothetical protein
MNNDSNNNNAYLKLCNTISEPSTCMRCQLQRDVYEYKEWWRKHNRSLKVAVQGLDFMAHPLYI